MDQHSFEKFRTIIYRESGIVLPPEKLPLLTNRIQKRLNALGLSNEQQYLKIIELDESGDELTKLIDVISTNVTYFYREPSHFQTYKSLLKQMSHKERISIWCAAASSGEEPYTLAFETREALGTQWKKAKILATDICTDVLKKAIIGAYPAQNTKGIPDETRDNYMHHINEQHLRVNEDIRNQILFKKLNLIRTPYPLKGPFDVIFCRNVMIYFDKETRTQIVREFERLLTRGGYLFISHSENLIGIPHNLKGLGSSVYQKVEGDSF